SITGQLTNRTVECGSNVTLNATVSGTLPLSFQWSVDGTPVPGATSSILSLINVHPPNHPVAFTVTNLYGSVTSNVLVTVRDTIPPTITLNGITPMSIELGSSFTDPGASANDSCAGAVPVVTTGNVNANALGTNTLVYIADDGNGNTNSTTRKVIVRDTTPPEVLWSFTNLIVAADSTCGAPMPDVTGTNFIIATDLSGIPTISQLPTIITPLLHGTNMFVLTATDASSNAVFSTNAIIVLDQTPPVITLNGDDPLFIELGMSFTDPGATANDACAGSVPVSYEGAINTIAIGTN